MRITLIAATLLIPALAPAQESAALTVALQDPTGALVAGAPVTLQSETIPERRFSGRSNARGTYESSAVPPDRYALIFHIQGFKRAVQDTIVLAAGQQKELPAIRLEVPPFDPKDGLEAFDVRLMFPRGENGNLVGSVVDLEALRSISILPSADIEAAMKDPGKIAPLAGTQVTLLCDESRICGSTRTGADGTFRFPDLTPGLYGLRVQRDGYYSEEFRRVEVYRSLELLYHVPIEACQTDDCDPKRRVEPEGIWL